MTLCLAQTKPVKGDIQSNINSHLKLTELAISNSADILIFPELSITGYEPTLAKELAMYIDDARLDVFQQKSDTHNITIGIGAPIKTEHGITISLLLFQPKKKREIYSKHYLHPDEEPYFVSGQNATGFIGKKSDTALAICYELSVPEHAEKAYQSGAGIYIASVAKSEQGIDKAAERLSQIAKDYAMLTLMVNCVGLNDGMVCGGRSSIWDKKGKSLGQLDNTREGILMIDTATEKVFNRQ